MNDKYMQPDIADLMTKIAKSIDDLNKSLGEFLQWQKERTEADIAIEQDRLRRITEANNRYMAGRWPRRDGDGFATVPRKFGSAEPLNADTPSGDIRPPNVS